jgi:hypothetical protein
MGVVTMPAFVRPLSLRGAQRRACHFFPTTRSFRFARRGGA